MNLIVVDNYEDLSKVAAKEFAKVINEKPNAVLGLATGGSPVGMYKELIKMYENKELDFSKITTVNLDEYVGLNPEHEQSYRHFMNENLFKYINLKKCKLKQKTTFYLLNKSFKTIFYIILLFFMIL